MNEGKLTKKSHHLNEISVKYLLSATNRLSSISSNALRCHWNILLADLMEMKNFAFSKREKKEKMICMYCQCPWRYGLFSVKVLPKPKRKKKLRKLSRKKEDGKELSKVEKKLAKAMDSRSTVVLNCKICHKSSKFKVSQILPSPKVVTPNVSIVQTRSQLDQVGESKLKKKKKRKKKKSKKNKAYSGLNPEVMKKIHGCRASNDTQKKGNKNIESVADDNDNNNDDVDDDDGDVNDKEIEYIENKSITAPKSRKRKIDNVVMNVLDSKSKKLIKLEAKKDVILASPLPIVSPVMKNKNSAPKYPIHDDFIPLDSSHSTPKGNKKQKKLIHNQSKKNGKNLIMNNKQFNVVHNEKLCNKSKRKNLNRWKMLISNEEANPPKTSSLKDFLSSL